MKKRLDGASLMMRDLRRTCRMTLRAIGVSQDTAEVVICHALTGLDAVYDQGTHVPETLAALEKYEAQLMAVIEPPLLQNVVKLRT
jgi:hypothetical protein